MKTFAALKRSVVVGTRIEVVHHWRDAARPDQPPITGTLRTVTKAQGNGYFYEQSDTPGKRCWGDWPTKAADLAFNADGSFTIRFCSDEARKATFRIITA